MYKLEDAFSVAVCGLYDENLLKFLKEEGNLRQKIGTQFFIELHGVSFCLSRAVVAAL